MSDLIKQYWKAVLAIVYAIAVPLYFYLSTRITEQALETSINSSKKQIEVLQSTIDEQSAYYTVMFEQYAALIEQEESRHNEQIQNIQQIKQYQQSLLSQKFNQDPTAITEELKKRYNLNGN
jgi:hypothetical protein